MLEAHGDSSQAAWWRRPAAMVVALYTLGSLLLPIAPFTHLQHDPQDYVAVLSNALPYGPWFNRATVLGPLCLIVSLWLSRRVPNNRARRWHWLDGTMLAWVAVPAVCGLFNPSEWHHDVGQSLYMAMVWGMPYAACRWAYRNQQDLVDALRVIVYLGLGSLVLAAFEFAFGRFWYTSLVGHHPYVDQGPSRYFGYRPLLFMEDPNQIGMWWTTVALAAMGLVRVRSTSTAGDKAIMPGWLAGILAVPPFLFQAIGAAILTIVGAVALACHRKTLLIAFVFLIGVGGVGFALRGPLLRHGRQFVESSPLGPTIRNVLRRSSIGSFGWRLGLEESTIELIRERALVGSGSVNFWREISRIERPWGMATLITGAYGLAGLSAWTIMFLMPCYMGLAARDTRGKHHDPGGRSVLRALLVILFLNFVDAFLNCGYLLPCLCLLGLVNSWIETTQE